MSVIITITFNYSKSSKNKLFFLHNYQNPPINVDIIHLKQEVTNLKNTIILNNFLDLKNTCDQIDQDLKKYY